MAKNKGRYGAVAGSSVGAMVGLAVAGPVGLVAGSLAGGAAARSYLNKKQESNAEGKKGLIDMRAEEENGELRMYDQTVEPDQRAVPADPSQAECKAKPYRLGDNLRYLTKTKEPKVEVKKGLIDLRSEEENGELYSDTVEFDQGGSHPFQAATTTAASRETHPSQEGNAKPYRLGDNLRYLTRTQEPKVEVKKGLIDLRAEEETTTASREALPSPEGEAHPQSVGDTLRGVVSRGKKAIGRDEGSPYKFGDFSRGLFSSKR
jgi:hypothetical protein